MHLSRKQGRTKDKRATRESRPGNSATSAGPGRPCTLLGSLSHALSVSAAGGKAEGCDEVAVSLRPETPFLKGLLTWIPEHNP